MNSAFRLNRFALLPAILLTGCFFEPSVAPVRHFVLAPVPANAPAATAEQISVGIGPVTMPSYLLRSPVAIRDGTNEIEYLEDARWGERLDQSFQRTLAANLSRLLPSEHVCSTDWAAGQTTVRVFVDVQQFDVDTHGRGIMIAHWRLLPPDSNTPLKSGSARLNREGPSPQSNAAVVAATLSDLAAEFSRTLVQPIRESVQSRN